MNDDLSNDETDLDKLLAELGADTDDSAAAGGTTGSADSGDTDLDALLASLGGDSTTDESTSSAESTSSTDSTDTDLDSLLSDLGTSSDDSTSDSSSADDEDDTTTDTEDRTTAITAAAKTRSKSQIPASSRPTFTATIGIRSAPKAASGSKLPLTLALLGDFSGRANRGITEPLAGRPGHLVDIDTLDSLYETLSPALTLEDPGTPGSQIELTFTELDDFHPDALIKKIPGLRDLRALRPQLLSASTAAKAAAALAKALGTPLPKPPRRTTAARTGESAAQTLERLLGAPAPNATARPTAPATAALATAENIVRQALAGNFTQSPTAHQKELVAALDAACTLRLRAILANPRFQALESAWRSLDMLVRTFDDADRIKLLIYDISKDELAADFLPPPPADAENTDATVTESSVSVPADPDPSATGLHKMLRDTTAESPWLAAFGLYTLGDSPADLTLAARIAAVFALNKTPLIAAGHPYALGCSSFATQPDPDHWTRVAKTEIGAALKVLRESPEAAYLALALPRVLLRLPYGRNAEPIDTYNFEEIDTTDQHEQYLWGNPAAHIARLYIERFKKDGWRMDLVAGQTVGDIPVHHFKIANESRMTPGAEAWLTERAVAAITTQGYIPVLSVKNSDTIRLGGIVSLSTDTSPLQLRVPQN